MSNLFIKFLPVEGEVKAGDKYLTIAGTISIADEDTEIINMVINNPRKKVLPHLCSRDIQAGDKYTSDADGEDTCIEIKDGVLIGERMHTHLVNSKNTGHQPYKVLGLISPDAEWVYDGMEVAQRDTRQEAYTYDEWYQKFDSKNRYKSNASIERYNSMRNGVKCYKLRCPSSPKHFH